ncbi:hypothetical protein T06_7312 [Trichinella sp. T6]|nr:hypothetical protein T06_7312 [Trichinella sp. T6]
MHAHPPPRPPNPTDACWIDNGDSGGALSRPITISDKQQCISNSNLEQWLERNRKDHQEIVLQLQAWETGKVNH